MADHRLYVTEAIAEPNDFPALLFSQSVSLIDENGTDLDTNSITPNSNTPGTSAKVTITFPQSGTLQFHCEYHQAIGMIGEIQVSG